jgi:hypothetical protein
MSEVFNGTVEVRDGEAGKDGDVIARDGSVRQVFEFDGQSATINLGAEGNAGEVRVFDVNGTLRIHLDGRDGDIKLLGADCAEHFDVRDGRELEPGTVLVIDTDGRLAESVRPYDRRVAGVVSGAGGFRPGLLLDSHDLEGSRKPVALMGKVYCKVDAEAGAIDVGDLLTTSGTAGHAMKATDPARAFGGVLGKALAPLRRGRGLVPILVTLQ